MNQDLIQGETAIASALNGHPGTEARVWAARITECWRSSVQGIIRTGRLLIEAKADLPHGEFGAMCDRDLPFSDSTAQRLMAIARDNRLSNPAHVQLLPASWGTLYELTKLSDEEFTSAVQQHVIRPDMLRGEAELIRPLTRQESQAKEPEADAIEARSGFDAMGSSRHVAGRTATTTSENLDVTAGETAPNSSSLPNGARTIMSSRVEDDDSLDFFPTPPWATRALIERVFAHLERRGHCKWQTCLEPACGEGHMAEVLREYFSLVCATDIKGYGYEDAKRDFLKADYSVEDDGLSPNWPSMYDWIITNPPFGDKSEAFVLRAIELAGTGVAMFVRLQWLETVGRYERLFRDNPPTLIAFFAERVPLHKDRWEPDGDTATAYIWLVWIKGAKPRAPFWIAPGQREALTRPDDAERFTQHPVKKSAIPEPAEGNDPDHTATEGVLIPSMVAEQSGEQEAGETSKVSAGAPMSPALPAPGEPASVKGASGDARSHAPPEFLSDSVIRSLCEATRARKAFPAAHGFSIRNAIVNGEMKTLGTCTCGQVFEFSVQHYERMDAAIETHWQKFDHLPDKIDGRGIPISEGEAA